MDAGDRFPEFCLRDQDGEPFDSSSLRGRRFIVYFYPRDGTAGCTRENVEFSESLPRLREAGVEVIGVSKDSVASHRRFADRNGLEVRLLSDPDHALLEAAGAWGVKRSYGKETLGTVRSTFLVGPDGVVERAWHNVRVAGHADEVAGAALERAGSQ